MTFRRLPTTDLFLATMTAWFNSHPGGCYTFCQRSDSPLTPNSARHYFDTTLKGTRWKRLRGFHTFRHSFASNLAAEGVDQRIIDEWMGHQTDEMKHRYRHLFPEQQHAAIASVFGEASVGSQS